MATRAVKYVVENFSHWSRNGYTERYSTITRTSDGKRLSFQHNGTSNVISGLAVLAGSYGHPAILDLDDNLVTFQEYQRATKDLPYFHGSGKKLAKQIRAAFRKV